MKILKFGGSSVGNAERIEQVVRIVKKESLRHQLVVVASAFGKVTNKLEQCGQLAGNGDYEYEKLLKKIETLHMGIVRELFPLQNQSTVIADVKLLLNELEDICHGIFLLKEVFPRTHDYLLGFGERLSAIILSSLLSTRGVKMNLLDARELILTDETYGNAQVNKEESYAQIRSVFSRIDGHAYVPGFIAASPSGKMTTLGRGGSDYTAALLAAALKTDMLEIWTDVDGVMTADPRMVSQALPLQKLSYEEIMELSHFGAKVVYPPTIQPVMHEGIPLWIKNTFKPEASGTLICKDGGSDDSSVKGLSHIDKIALITLSGGGMVGVSGVAARLFSALSVHEVNVIFITQASSEHSITLAIQENQVETARKAIIKAFENELALSKINDLLVENGLSIVALVGDRMKSSVGLSGRAFDALGKNGVNIRAIAQGSTERNISIVVSQKDVSKSLNTLHETFFLSKYKKIHLFLVGVGNVGGTLIRQISDQSDYLKNEHGLELKIVGLANSRKMLFIEQGIRTDNWQKMLMEQGETMTFDRFLDKMNTLNLRNSVFVDNTASKEVADLYHDILQKSVSVVASNKIAASSGFSNYRKLLQTAKEKNVKFLYETNVGAGLPVIKTIQDMLKSGDEIFRIQAVLSGSLNFIFNHFVARKSFAGVVGEAMSEGFTEPDPRIDLSGEDVRRKILILARESGFSLEIDEVENNAFMPEELMKIETVNDFMKALPEYDGYFEEIRKEADKKGMKLRYIAEMDHGKAGVGLRSVDASQPYYQLDGKDNIVLIYSRRYKEQPLVIRGAGAGASVTASGVFADIISLVNQ